MHYTIALSFYLSTISFNCCVLCLESSYTYNVNAMLRKKITDTLKNFVSIYLCYCVRVIYIRLDTIRKTNMHYVGLELAKVVYSKLIATIHLLLEIQHRSQCRMGRCD